MKKLATIIAVGAGLLTFKNADAQIGLHLNLHIGNIGAHVVVAPPVQDVNYTNYDNDDDYYYLPDVEAYYDVAQQCYYYNDGQQWIHAAYLPGRYHDFDWRNARHYEVRAQRPYLHHDEYRTRFGGFDQRGGAYDNHRNDNRGWNNDNRGQYQNNGQQNRDRGNRGEEHFAANKMGMVRQARF